MKVQYCYEFAYFCATILKYMCRFLQLPLKSRHRIVSTMKLFTFTTTLCHSSHPVSSVQFSHSVVSKSVTPWTVEHQAFLSFIISQSLLKLMSFELVVPFNHLNLCCPFLLLPSVLPSIRIFSNESVLLIKGPKYWSFSSASVLPMTIQH